MFRKICIFILSLFIAAGIALNTTAHHFDDSRESEIVMCYLEDEKKLY